MSIITPNDHRLAIEPSSRVPEILAYVEEDLLQQRRRGAQWPVGIRSVRSGYAPCDIDAAAAQLTEAGWLVVVMRHSGVLMTLEPALEPAKQSSSTICTHCGAVR